MAKYLRDEHLKNITINEQSLELINSFLIERGISTNREVEQANGSEDDILRLTYIIRFDNRGYKLTDYNDVKKYFSQADKIERIIFTLDSNTSERTNRMYGTYYETRFDSIDPNNTYIQVASDDGDAVDAVFSGLKEIINKGKNNNGHIRNTWSQLLVQIFGVAVGFLISLIAGLKASPHLNIENSFVISFLFAFLIFSNAWGFINQQLLRFLDFAFPNVRFVQPNKNSWHWLAQALVGGLVVALTLLFISGIFEWVGKILGQFIAK